MSKIKFHLDQNLQQLISHGDFSFPFEINYHSLSDFEENKFPYHWHPAIEFDIMLSGTMIYQAGGKKFILTKGESLYCSSNCLHAGSSATGEDCRYIALTFHPRMLYGYPGSIMDTKYVTPLLNAPDMQAIPLRPDNGWQQRILQLLHEVCEQDRLQADGYEFYIRNLLNEIWLLLYRNQTPAMTQERPVFSTSQQATRLELILGYLHGHYNEAISLKTIADLVGLSTSECCRFFKKHMHLSIFDYLQEHRIKSSLPLLLDGEHNITETASSVGFSSSSYYTQIFKKHMGITPSEYRLEIR